MPKLPLFLRLFLIVSGSVGIAVGVAILFFPGPFYALSGISLGGNLSLLNEIRAPGGALIATGIFVLIGLGERRLTLGSVAISTLVYLAYGMSRCLSLAIDGLPTMDLVVVAVAEIVIGVWGVVVWIGEAGRGRVGRVGRAR